MKIAIDCRMSGKSGIGSFFDGIMEHIVLSKNNLVLLVLDKNNLPQRLNNIILNNNLLQTKNIELVSCQIKPFSIKELLFFPKPIAKKINECDVYFSPYCNIPSSIKIPIYTTIHDIVFLDIPSLAGKIGTFIRKQMYLYSIFRSNALFTVSEFSKSRIQKKLKCKKNIYVVYNACPSIFLEQDNSIKKTNTIIFIGNIKKHKGLSVLLKAFNIFREEQKTLGNDLPQLVIVGSKDNFRTKDNSLNSLLHEEKQNGVVFTGYVTDQELKLLLTQAKILVQPSFYEGFGMPPLQALYCKTKVILSDIPVFKEIYKDFPVTFFSCGNAEELAKKISEQWASSMPPFNMKEKYSFEKTANMILKVLENKN